MTLTNRMKTYLAERIHITPNEIAEEIANGTFKVPRDVHLDEADELAARLARWIATEAEEFIDPEAESDWPFIAMMADLVAMAMEAQHRADLRAALGINKAPPQAPLWATHPEQLAAARVLVEKEVNLDNLSDVTTVLGASDKPPGFIDEVVTIARGLSLRWRTDATRSEAEQNDFVVNKYEPSEGSAA